MDLEPLPIGEGGAHPGCEENGSDGHKGPGNDHEDAVGSDEHRSCGISLGIARVCGWVYSSAREGGVTARPQVVGRQVDVTGGGPHPKHAKVRIIEVKVLHTSTSSVTAGCQTTKSTRERNV